MRQSRFSVCPERRTDRASQTVIPYGIIGWISIRFSSHMTKGSATVETNRPVLKVSKTRTENVHDVLCAAVFAVMLAYLFLAWAGLPARFPTHFNAAGEADGWGGKPSLLPLPIINIVVYAGLTLLGKYPHAFNYPCEINAGNAYRQYSNARMMLSWIKLEITVSFGYIEWSMIHVALGNRPVLWILPFILITVIGTVLFYLFRAWRIT
jgi:uncharacterized membrane protein